MPSVVKESVDFLRISPFGNAITASGGLALSIELYAASEVASSEPVLAGMLGGAALLSAGVAGVGTHFTRLRLSAKRRMENFLDKYGFDDRYFGMQTESWCERQTARVVCQNAGVIADFEQVCEANRENARLSWLPHI